MVEIKSLIKQKYIYREFEALGTINLIKIFDSFDEDLLDTAVGRVNEIENIMSAFRADSDISRLSRSAGVKSERLHKETIELLSIAKDLSDLSDGSFDITVRPLVELWGIGKKQNFIPSKHDIKKVRRLINYRDIELDFEKQTGFLKRAGQAADLGGIAKGYAADEVRRILIQGGVKSAIINLGGNVIAVGSRTDNNPWQIGIQNPAAATGVYLGTLNVTDKTIVTSGSNERFFIKDGVRYHHILDPRTGFQAQSGLLSVTAVCESSTIADAVTTAVFVLGMEHGLSLLRKSGAEAIFVHENMKVFITEGLLNSFEIKKC